MLQDIQDTVSDSYDTVKDWAENNPKKAILGSAFALDVTTNGGDMTIDAIQFFGRNDGVAEAAQGDASGAVKGFVYDLGEVVEESNDVAFNWLEKTMEGGKYLTGLAGDVEDGNIAKGVFIAGDVVAEFLKDGEEYLFNYANGNGWERSQDFEHMRNLLSDGSESAVENGGETPSLEPGEPETPEGGQGEGTPDGGTGGSGEEFYGEINAYEIFDQSDHEALDAFFQDAGTPEELGLNFNSERGIYELHAGDQVFELEQDGQYGDTSYNIDGKEMQEIVKANEQGNLEDVFDEFYRSN